MALIWQTIVKAVQENLAVIVLLLISVASMYLINIILGTILGKMDEGFDWRKFMFGFVKLAITCICIFAFCYILNLFSLTLELIKISVSAEIITTAEVLAVVATYGIDLAKDIIEKIKGLKELKYVAFSDVKVDDGRGSEEAIG